ncbi:MAG: hypothetical protein P8Y97_16215 [Candidatus Lokiarchaeota archaeon]
MDKESVLNHGGFVNYRNVELDADNSKSIEIFIEKQFLEELKKSKEVVVELKTWKRFGRKMSSLSINKGIISEKINKNVTCSFK